MTSGNKECIAAAMIAGVVVAPAAYMVVMIIAFITMSHGYEPEAPALLGAEFFTRSLVTLSPFVLVASFLAARTVRTNDAMRPWTIAILGAGACVASYLDASLTSVPTFQGFIPVAAIGAFVAGVWIAVLFARADARRASRAA